MSNNQKILILGATGFLGRHLVEELLLRGYTDLTAVVRHTSDTAFLKNKRVNIVYADISDKNSLDNLNGNWEVIFHCAGLVSSDKRMLEKINFLGTENIFSFAYARNVKKIIYTSSVAVNSGNTQMPLTEDLPYQPTNDYGVSKTQAEQVAVDYSKRGLPVVIVRPCMVYGQGEPHLLPLLVKLIRRRLFFLPYFADVRLHLVSARNVAACFVTCMENEAALGKIFNIADKEILTVRQLCKIVARTLNVKEPPVLPRFLTNFLMRIPVLGDHLRFLSKERIYSIEALQKILNFSPPYPAESEMVEVVKGMK